MLLHVYMGKYILVCVWGGGGRGHHVSPNLRTGCCKLPWTVPRTELRLSTRAVGAFNHWAPSATWAPSSYRNCCGNCLQRSHFQLFLPCTQLLPTFKIAPNEFQKQFLAAFKKQPYNTSIEGWGQRQVGPWRSLASQPRWITSFRFCETPQAKPWALC